MSTYVVIIEEDEDGNLVIPIPTELGWLEGDEVLLTINNNSVILTNITNQERIDINK